MLNSKQIAQLSMMSFETMEINNLSYMDFDMAYDQLMSISHDINGLDVQLFMDEFNNNLNKMFALSV